MPNATQSTSEQQINQINLWMRSQPWYQDWFRARGLNPNQVRLSDQQRNDLMRVATQNGVTLGDRMKIDEAGNVNQKGGFAGMPTWAKVAIAAAPAAATAGFGLAGIGPAAGLAGGGGGAGVGAGGLGSGLSAAASGAAYHAGSPLLMGAGSAIPIGTAAAAVPTIASRAIGNGMGTTPSLIGSTAAGVGSAGIGGALGNAAGSAIGKLGEGLVNNATDTGIDALMRLIPALAGIIPAVMANKESDADKALKQKQLDLLAIQEGRLKEQAPLYSDVQHMTRAMLPIFGRKT